MRKFEWVSNRAFHGVAEEEEELTAFEKLITEGGFYIIKIERRSSEEWVWFRAITAPMEEILKENNKKLISELE